jgi:sRNA-binding protein
MSARLCRERTIRARAIIEAPCELWPRTFAFHERNREPVALGIHRAVPVAVAPAIMSGTIIVKDIERALARYAGSNGHLCNMRAGASRIDLARRVAATVTKDEAQPAKHLLDQRRADSRAAKQQFPTTQKKTPCAAGAANGVKASIEHHDRARQAAWAQARPPKPDIPNAIAAELFGSDTASAAGISVTGYTPVLELCRRLVAAGHDPATPLHAYRGLTLCLKIRSIGEAVTLEINARGDGFRPRRAADAGSPMAEKRRPAGRAA